MKRGQNAIEQIDIRTHFLLLVLVTIFNSVYQLFIGSSVIIFEDGSFLQAEYFYDDFVEVIWVVLTFTFLLRVKLDRILARVVDAVSPYIMGIYILHPIIRKYTANMINANSAVGCVLQFIMTFSCSYLGAVLIKKVHLDKYFMRL